MFNLCDHLSKKMVEKDPTLCELFNENIEFFVNPNLEINLVSITPLYLLLCCCNIYLLVEPIL
jgi:hypothetical protein